MCKKLFFPVSIVVLMFGIIVPAIENANAANYPRECEDYNSVTWGGTGTPEQIRLESHSAASGEEALHIGPDWSPDDSYGVNDEAVYTVNLQECDNASIKIKYSDDVAGNVIKVYLDDVEKGQFITFFTGGWNVFEWTNSISLGSISAGQHTIKLKVSTGGSYGAVLDVFEIRNSMEDMVSYLKSSINANTGLVKSREGEEYNGTTVYKNALSAMAFIHQGDTNSANGIFNFFKSVYDADPNDFHGFVQWWDAGTGQPIESDYWVGDNAFLLIALNYYNQVNNGLGDYADLSDALVEWLTEEGNDCSSIIGEGVADMYAALAPFEGDEDVDMALIKLKARFYDEVSYAGILDHTTRASLIFGDLDGFNYLDNFERTETWDYDNITTVSGYSAFDSEDFINIEISAQLLNVWGIWSSDLAIDLSGLKEELEKTWLNGTVEPNSCGLPYYVTDSGFDYAYSMPIIDSTAYMLFSYWNFNSCAPGKEYATISFDFCECEDYNSVTFGGVGTSGIRLEAKTNASSCQVLHIGPDWSPDNSYGVNDEATYMVDLQDYNYASIKVRYADDVAGNVIKIYLDDVEKGQFTTLDTGTWNDFEWTEPISLGAITEGQHSIKLKVATGGSYGLGLDVFKIERRNIVHFSMPYSQRQQANYSGAACMKMALDYEGINAYTQADLHSYGVANNYNQDGNYVDPHGMYITLNHYELNANYNYSAMSATTLNDAYHSICYWIEYDIAGATPQNMPTIIPLGGNYENWVLVNGFSASANPWATSNYTVYGFWITDPSASGIGENVYKTAAELANDYIMLDTTDTWDGKYVTVCEPPAKQAQVTIAQPVKYKEKLNSKKDIIDAAVKGLQDNVLKSDKGFETAYIGSYPGKPVQIKDDSGSYFIVPFVKNNGCSVAVIVDAADGTFRQASYSKTPDAGYLKRFEGKKGKEFRSHKGKNAFLPQVTD
ncbi:MAG: carbohydrate-binding protein [Phycisphaerae bacterium]|jgi:hypothetical protein